MKALFACLILLMQGQSPEFLSDREQWPDTMLAEFRSLTEDQQSYAVMMLSEAWPQDHVSGNGETIVFAETIRVRQVVGKAAFIAELGTGDTWIEGVSVEVIADDAVVSCDGFAFINDGTHSYTTVLGGSKTVKKLRGFSVGKADEFVQSVLSRRGYRLFRLNRVDGNPWMIATVSSITKLSVVLQQHDKTKSKLTSDYFDSAGREWLSDKENIKAMQKTKREFDATSKTPQ